MRITTRQANPPKRYSAMSIAAKYLLFGLLSMLVIIYVLGWHDMIANGLLSKDFMDNDGVIHYFKYDILIGSITIALTLYGIGILNRKKWKPLLWCIFISYCLGIIPHLLVWPLWMFVNAAGDYVASLEFLYTSFFLPICLIILAARYLKRYGRSIVASIMLYLTFLTCIWLSAFLWYFVWLSQYSDVFQTDPETFAVLAAERFLGYTFMTIGFVLIYFSSRKKIIEKPNV